MRRRRTGALGCALAATLAVLPGSAAAMPVPSELPTDAGGWVGAPTIGAPLRSPVPVSTGWGPSEAEIGRARALVESLSLRQRAGQVIVAAYRGTGSPTALVNRLHLGGVIVFSENISSAGQIERSNRALQRSAAAAGRRWPVLVGVDQEGGLVEGVTQGTRFPAFMTAGAADDSALTTDAFAGSGAELRGLGFTMDFAPDADVTVGPRDPAIGSRSAGSRPALVARQSTAAAKGFLRSGMVPVLKHFPGHGSVTADSHLTLPEQRATLARLISHDLVPFQHGVDAGLPVVMTGHIDVRSVDPGVPSSLSKPVVTGLLRQRLGFQGLAVTDSLSMGAVVQHYGTGGAAVRVLKAGEDLLLMPDRPQGARDAVVAAVKDHRLSQARLDQAVVRQVALLLHQKAAGGRAAALGSAARLSRRLSAGGVTVGSGPCSGRIVGRSVQVRGPAVLVARFEAAGRAAGMSFGHGPTVGLVGYRGAAPTGADVVVATDTPYVLGRTRAPLAKIATYGGTPGAMRSLVAVLRGTAAAPGRLPVHVSGVARSGC